jgi:hypothetical protein
LPDGFDGYGWILCKPGNEGVAGIVKAALDLALATNLIGITYDVLEAVSSASSLTARNRSYSRDYEIVKVNS